MLLSLKLSITSLCILCAILVFCIYLLIKKPAIKGIVVVRMHSVLSGCQLGRLFLADRLRNSVEQCAQMRPVFLCAWSVSLTSGWACVCLLLYLKNGSIKNTVSPSISSVLFCPDFTQKEILLHFINRLQRFCRHAHFDFLSFSLHANFLNAKSLTKSLSLPLSLCFI